MIATEDKQRYDREVTDFKKGQFLGRTQTPIIKIQNQLDSVSSALEISDDLLQFLQVKSNNDQSTGDQVEEGPYDQETPD
jgi:hypothetical protein